MPDTSTNQDLAVSAVPNGSSGANSGTSPWDEPLPQEQPKGKIIGTLTSSASADEGGNPFKVPENIEARTLPSVVSANDVNNFPQAASTPTTETPAIGPDPAFSYQFEEPKQAAPSTPVIEAKPASPVPSFEQPQSAAPSITNDLSTPENQVPRMQTPAPAPLRPPIQDIKPAIPETPIAPANLNNQVLPTPPAPSTLPVSPVVPPASLETASKPQQTMPVAPPLVSPLTPPPSNQSTPVAAPIVGNNEPTTKIARLAFRLKIPFFLLLPLILIALLVYLTEIGFLSLGLEKVYGLVGMERIWGGLPSNSEKALMQSFSALSSYSSFKTEGTVSLNIDKTIKNSVTTPLVSQNGNDYILGILPVKAVLASSADSESDGTWVFEAPPSWDSYDGIDTQDNTTETPANNQTVAEADSSQTEEEIGDTQLPVFGGAGTTYVSSSATKPVNLDVSATFGSRGNEATIKVLKPVGFDIIELKNSGSKLWVKSDKFKFSDKMTAGKWLPANISLLKGSSLMYELFSVKNTNGFSATGKRTGNEKIGDTRCYKYVFDNIEVGDTFSGIGIKSDAIQKISGTVWIGIKDKLIRKIDLKVTPASSSPIVQMNLSLNLSNFNVDNAFAEPAMSEVTDVSK